MGNLTLSTSFFYMFQSQTPDTDTGDHFVRVRAQQILGLYNEPSPIKTQQNLFVHDKQQFPNNNTKIWKIFLKWSIYISLCLIISHERRLLNEYDKHDFTDLDLEDVHQILAFTLSVGIFTMVTSIVGLVKGFYAEIILFLI